jgi:aspartate/methionine/tyrosine aminotransferase
VVAGIHFGERGKNFIRISFAQPNLVLEQALSIIGEYHASL